MNLIKLRVISCPGQYIMIIKKRKIAKKGRKTSCLANIWRYGWLGFHVVPKTLCQFCVLRTENWKALKKRRPIMQLILLWIWALLFPGLVILMLYAFFSWILNDNAIKKKWLHFLGEDRWELIGIMLYTNVGSFIHQDSLTTHVCNLFLLGQQLFIFSIEICKFW